MLVLLTEDKEKVVWYKMQSQGSSVKDTYMVNNNKNIWLIKTWYNYKEDERELVWEN